MLKKRLIIIILAVFTVISVASGITLAYIYRQTPPVQNTFEPVYVSCSVEETVEDGVHSDIKVKNTGDIDAYVRVTFVAMWVDENGTVLGRAPVLGTDYTVTFGSPKWMLGSDGFYYYSTAVHAGAYADIFITSVTPIGTAPDGYTLKVHVAATAIQSEPASAVEGAWGVTVQQNGGLVAP